MFWDFLMVRFSSLRAVFTGLVKGYVEVIKGTYQEDPPPCNSGIIGI